MQRQVHSSNSESGVLNNIQAKHKIGHLFNEEIKDPKLTLQGGQQCKEFAASFKNQIRHVTQTICSPMTRTIKTAMMVFKDAKVKIYAMPELQNFDSGPNGQRQSLRELTRRYRGRNLVIDVAAHGKTGWDRKKDGEWSSGKSQWRVDHIMEFLHGLRIESKGNFLKWC
jgi:hypothetical protein